MGKLVLVRHGQTTANVAKRLDTAPPGAALTELGHEQAERYGQSIAASLPAIVVASTALRARQTAAHIARATGVDATERDGIFEAQAGDWEDRSDAEAQDGFTAIYQRWHAGDRDARVPGGDSATSVLDRFVPVLDDLRDRYLTADGGDVLVVSHGAAIRLVAAVLADVDGSFAADTHLDNTETVELVPVDGGGWTCVRWGTFLPPFEGKGSDTADNPIS